MGGCCSSGCRYCCLWLFLFEPSFFQRDVLDELLDLVGLVSEGFSTYPFQREGFFYIASNDKKAFFISDADRNYNLLSCQKVWNSQTIFILDMTLNCINKL